MGDLAPEVLKRLTCGREASADNFFDKHRRSASMICVLGGGGLGEQVGRAM